MDIEGGRQGMATKQGEKIIGIDLGTTNSVVAVMEGKEPKVSAGQIGIKFFPVLLKSPQRGSPRQGIVLSQTLIITPRDRCQ